MDSEKRRGQGLGIFLAIGLIIGFLLLVIFFTPLGLIVFVPIQMAKIHRIEKRMQTPQIYTQVATNMALYCQSVDVLNITNSLGSSRLPQPLPQLGSPWGMVESNYAHIEIGGGFYHYGYRLERDDSASDSLTNVWELRFASEDQAANKLLLRFGLSTSARFPVAAFLRNSLTEYDARIAKNPSDISLYKAKLKFLSQYDKGQLRPACSDTVKAFPNHWWPRLTLALLDSGAGNYGSASSNLVNFVEGKPSYSRYMHLAYFYQLREKPDEAAKAVEKAITCPIVEGADDDQNTECFGYAMGVYLYEQGRYSSVIKLCDVLLPLKINGNYAKSALSDLKACAQASFSGGKPNFIPSESVLGFNPYEGFNISSILSP